VTIAFGVLWADWSWQFYNKVVSTERSRLTRGVTYMLRLPIDTKGVTTIIGASSVETYPNETYYKVIYPQSKQSQLAKDTPVGQITELVIKGNGPAVILEDEADVEPLKAAFEKMGKKVQIFRRPEFPGAYLYVE